MIAATRSSSRIVFRPLPQDDPHLRRPVITRARELLHWSPRTPFEEGLRRTVEDLAQRMPAPVGADEHGAARAVPPEGWAASRRRGAGVGGGTRASGVTAGELAPAMGRRASRR